MSWYYGKFECGCDGRIQVYGKTSERQRKADWVFENCKCEACKKKEWEAEKEKAYKKAIENSKSLPELTGTQKQIKWALTLRDKFIEKYSKALTSYDDKILFYEDIKQYEELKELLKTNDKNFDKEFRKYFIENKKSSVFWIETRNFYFGNFVEIAIKEIKKTNN